MENAELRKARAELHKVIVETVLSFNGTALDDAKMYQYIIELATYELIRMCS